jgi:sterol desaturase/sphingolipid hydroxylase (fatty acid hydroxylase superfamily)
MKSASNSRATLSDAVVPDVAGRRVWGLFFWAFVAAITLILAGAVLKPGLARDLADANDAFGTAFRVFYGGFLPSGLRPFVEAGARVFLSPWLYLVMFGVFLAEKYIPVNCRQPIFGVGVAHDFVAWFVVDGFARALVVGGLVAALSALHQNVLGGFTIEATRHWGLAVKIVAAVLALDFLNWLHHWLRHKVKALWVFHAIHHSQREMNMFTDLRVHVFEHVVAKPIGLLPLFVLGLDVEPALWIALIREYYPRVYHANVRTNFGWLKYILVTPQSHRIHHSVDPRHQDRNFGVLLSIWDQLFGSQWRDYAEYPATGIGDRGFPHESSVRPLAILGGYLRQQLYPLRVLWRAATGRGWELSPGLLPVTRSPGDSDGRAVSTKGRTAQKP